MKAILLKHTATDFSEAVKSSAMQATTAAKQGKNNIILNQLEWLFWVSHKKKKNKKLISQENLKYSFFLVLQYTKLILK